MHPGALPGHLPNRQYQRSRPVKGSNIAEPPRPCTTARQLQTAGHQPRHTGLQQLRTLPGQRASPATKTHARAGICTWEMTESQGETRRLRVQIA
jgi:hypothetical protein